MTRFPLHPRRLCTLLLAGAVGMALPAAAEAATVGYSTGTITYTTAPGEANHVTVEPAGYWLKFTETGTKGTTATPIALYPVSGCYPLSSSVALCPAGALKLSADLTDGNDFFDASLIDVPLSVKGGPGNDVLRGGTGVDTLDGGGNDDVFEDSDEVADKVICGPGSDSGSVDALDTLSADCEAVQRVTAPAPTAPDPAPPATDPGTTDPGPTGPGTTDPGTSDPGSTDPGTSDPGSTDPGSTDPGSTDPRTGEHGTTDSGNAAANLVPVTIPPQTVGVSPSGVASVQVNCPADSGGCSGTVRLVLPTAASATARARASVSAARSRAPITLGRAKFKAKAGTSPIVRVRLSKRGRQRILRGRRGKRAQIVITTRRADGTVSTASQDVTIRPKRQAAKRRRGRTG